MGPHSATLDAGGAPSLNNSPRQRGDHVVHKHSRRGATCSSGKTRSAKLLAVLALAIIAGCTTVTLQLVASARNGPRHAGEAGGAELSEPGRSDVVPPLPSDHQPSWEQEHPYVDIDSIVVPSRFRGRPLVDRRYTGQRTGRPPKPEEELPFRPPAPRDGPFGWGTDWVQGVGTPAVPPDPGEDLVEPAWCQASAGNRSFVDSVMRRRAKPVNSSERVVSCTRTKDRGRYLPEWVAYHWALGVDVMDIFDDDSVDDTREVLEPFVRAGMVKFQPHRVRQESSAAAATATATDNQHRDTSDASRNGSATDAAEALMAPINECVERYREMHHQGDPLAPSWVVLVDTDEFLWGAAVATEAESGGNATNSLPEVLASQSTTCCLKVSAVRHGTSGFSKTPRGLLLENFLTHADPASLELNGPPKAIVDLRASTPAGEGASSGGLTENTGASSRSSTLGDVLGAGTTFGGNFQCHCTAAPAAEMAVRRYPTTREDLESKERRYAALQQQQQQQQPATAKFVFDAAVETGELNERRSDGILAWRCVVRRVLSRAANGENVVTGRPEGSLSPHHPITHGHGGWAIDPNGDYERQRTEACVSVVRSSPTVEDTIWGRIDSPPVWLQHACSTRYVFVHSFEGTGERKVVGALESHPWTRSHVGQAAVAGGGCTITSAISTAGERKEATGTALFEMCGCTSHVAPGCWRYCPKLQRRILAATGLDSSSSSSNNINRARRQLVQDWLLRFNFGTEPVKQPVVLVERDPDFLVASKQGLFPFVSTSILTVRHPLCSPAADGGSGEGGGGDAAGVREWRSVWRQVLVKQVPHAKGDIWVVRFEDLLSQEEETTSALWAAVGLPPVSPYGSAGSARNGGSSGPPNGSMPGAASGRRLLRSRGLIVGDPLSRASPAVRNQAIPASCRARVLACERDSECELELLRSASLLDYFGYGGNGEILNSQRFLWGKEELEWLGERLGSARDAAAIERLHRPSVGQADGTVLGSDDDGEPSVVLPQAPQPLKRSNRRQGAP